MDGPRKYPDELRERATRMAVELRQDAATEQGAIALVAEQLGIDPENLRNWVGRPRSTATLGRARRRRRRSALPPPE